MSGTEVETKAAPKTVKDRKEVLEIYSIYSESVRRDGDIINQRSGRFVLLQSALIVAYGFSLQSVFSQYSVATDGYDSRYIAIACFLIFIALVGALSSFTTLVSLVAARKSQISTLRAYHEIGPASAGARTYAELAVTLGLPRLTGGGVDTPSDTGAPEQVTIPFVAEKDGSLSTLVPKVLIVLWLLILLTALHLLVSVLLEVVAVLAVGLLSARYLQRKAGSLAGLWKCAIDY